MSFSGNHSETVPFIVQVQRKRTAVSIFCTSILLYTQQRCTLLARSLGSQETGYGSGHSFFNPASSGCKLYKKRIVQGRLH